MEFLFVVIIIISLISSISKNIKKQIKKEATFDPWSFGSDSGTKLDHEMELQKKEFEEEIPDIEEKKEEKSIKIEEGFQEFFSENEALENDVDTFQPYVETIEEEEENEVAFLRDLKKADTSTIPTGDISKELKTLLTGKKLPLGIIASEVLCSPRALRPYRPKR